MRSFKVGTFWIRVLATFVANPAAFSSPLGPLVSLLRPANNSIVPPTFDYNAAVEVPDHKAFSRSHKEALLCLSTDGADAECVDLWTSSFGATDMPLGAHTVAAWIVDSQSGGSGSQKIALPLEMGYNLSETTVTHFTVVSTDEWKAWVASGAEVNNNAKEQVAIVQEKRMVAPSLLEWHRFQKLDDSPKDPVPWSCTSVQSPVLMIGIKTHAKGFKSRDALRRTWLNGLGDAPKAKACAWFLIGDPTNASPHVTRALQNERDLYEDILLGDELNCTDGYLDLVAKAKGFMKFTSDAKSLSWQWLMMLDDDVYLKVHNLVDALVSSAPTEKFYAGQVWASHFGHPIKPIRYEKHQNYLSFEDYPPEELPPFAIGPHYILSRDVVKYIGANSEVLHGVGTLEDVSVASWLQGVDIHPVHVDHFSNVRTFGCVEGAVSLADLTPAGMLRLYEREESKTSRCEGYQDRWTKEPWRHSSETQIKNEGLEMIPWNLLWSNSTEGAVCDGRQDGVDFSLISPVAGGIYSTDSLTFMVNIIRCSEDIQPGLMSEVCVQLDDGESLCAGLDDSVRFFHSSFNGVMVGTHKINVWLRDPGDKHQISSRSVIVDTVNVASTTTTTASTSSINQTIHPSRSVPAAETVAPTRVAILAINLLQNSQTSIFEAIALNAPKPDIDIHVFTTAKVALKNSNATNSEEIVTSRRLLQSLVPVHVVDLLDDQIITRSIASVLQVTEKSDELLHGNRWADAPLVLRMTLYGVVKQLESFHVATVANSLGVPQTGVLVELARLARRPRVLLELPNLYPSIPDLALSVDAIVAPSSYALGHASVRSFAAAVRSRLGSTSCTVPAIPDPIRAQPCRALIEEVVHPAMLRREEFAECPSSLISWTGYNVTVAIVGRLSPVRSPGIALHAVFAAVRVLRHASAAVARDKSIEYRIRVVVVGDGALRDGLEQMVRDFKRAPDGSNSTDPIDVDVFFAGTLSKDAVLALLSGICEQGSASSSGSENRISGIDRSVPVVALNGRLEGETFGIANAEALTSGATVICFDVGANRESTLAAVAPCAARATLVASPFTPQRLGDALAKAIAPDLMARIDYPGSLFDQRKWRNMTATAQRQEGPQQNACIDKAIEHFSAAHFIDRYAALYHMCRKAVQDEEASTSQIAAPSFSQRHVTAAAVAETPEPVKTSAGILSVVYSGGAKYLHGLLETLLPGAFPTLAMRIDSESNDEESASDQPAADVRIVVVSCLDGGCRDGWSPPCQGSLVDFVRKSCGIPSNADDSRPCLVLVACGEPWDLSELDEILPRDSIPVDRPSALRDPRIESRIIPYSVLALHASTVTQLLPSTWPALHLSVAASSFGERLEAHGHADPRMLLAPALVQLADHLKPSAAALEGVLKEWRHSRPNLAAYLYFRCDRPARERFLQLLRANESPTSMRSGVIALGACNGSGVNSISATGTERHETFVEARFGTGWHDAAVAAYKPFRFVVCFENSWTTEGYITEKVINAMLAGAIPIVLAHSPSLVQLGLNPRSMVDCSEFGPRSTELSSSPASWSSADLDATLARCAAHVAWLDQSPQDLFAVLSQPRVESMSHLSKGFAWHGAVDGHADLAHRLRLLLQGGLQSRT